MNKKLIKTITLLGFFAFCAGCTDKLPSGRSFISTSETANRLDAARFAVYQKAVEKCMRTAGFEYRAKRRTSNTVAFVPLGEPGRNANTFGVTKAISLENSRPESTPTNFSPSDKLAFEKQLFGTGSDLPNERGCIARAREEERTVLSKILLGFKKEKTEFDADLKVKKYRQKWETCMRKNGFPFSTRSDFLVGLLNEYTQAKAIGVGIDTLEKRERQAVESDRRCISDGEETEFQNIASGYRAKAKSEFLNK